MSDLPDFDVNLNHMMIDILFQAEYSTKEISKHTGKKPATIRSIKSRLKNKYNLKDLEDLLFILKRMIFAKQNDVAIEKLLLQNATQKPLPIASPLQNATLPINAVTTKPDYRKWNSSQLTALEMKLGLKIQRANPKKKEFLTKYYNEQGIN